MEEPGLREALIFQISTDDPQDLEAVEHAVKTALRAIPGVHYVIEHRIATKHSTPTPEQFGEQKIRRIK